MPTKSHQTEATRTGKPTMSGDRKVPYETTEGPPFEKRGYSPPPVPQVERPKPPPAGPRQKSPRPSPARSSQDAKRAG